MAVLLLESLPQIRVRRHLEGSPNTESHTIYEKLQSSEVLTINNKSIFIIIFVVRTTSTVRPWPS